MNKLIIVGSSGYISRFLVNELGTMDNINTLLKIDKVNTAETRDTMYLDLQNSEQFDYTVLSKNDYVIFTAAVSSPDMCAEQYDLCWSINVSGTKYFIKKALQTGCRVLFFSSDAVFAGNRELYFTEDSKTEGETPYGKMKKAIEDEFRFDDNFKAIRLSYVVSEKDKFVSYCLNCLREGVTAEIYHPFYRNCITIKDIIKTVKWFITNWDLFPSPFLNVAGAELVSRVRMADELNRIFDGRLNYTIVKPDKKFYLNRPAVTQMKSKYLFDYNILENLSFSEKMRNVIKGTVQ